MRGFLKVIPFAFDFGSLHLLGSCFSFKKQVHRNRSGAVNSNVSRVQADSRNRGSWLRGAVTN